MIGSIQKKWFATISLAIMILILAIIGGKWGSSYSVSASPNIAPVIDSISPALVEVRSPDTQITITGSNFGNQEDTGVFIYGGGYYRLLPPADTITPNYMTVVITDTLLVSPINFILQVVKTTDGTPPISPTLPHPNEEVSNPVRFSVWSPDTYFPIIQKNALR